MMIHPEFRKIVYDTYLHEKLGYCYQCNRCTENCPVHKEVASYDPRQLILMSLMGIDIVNEANRKMVFLCTMCDTCDEVCPNDIPLTHIFSVLKNMAAQRGISPFGGQGKAMIENGTSVPIGPAIVRRRTAMGLPEKYDLPVDEVKAIAEATGLAGIVKKLNPEA